MTDAAGRDEPTVDAIYLLAVPAEERSQFPGDGDWVSLERNRRAPGELVAYPTAEAAVRALAFDEPLLPAPFIGDEPVNPLSDLRSDELAARLEPLIQQLGGPPDRLLSIHAYDGELGDVYLSWRSYDPHDFLGELTPEQLDELLALFPYRMDSTLVGGSTVLRVEVED
jgi:hypothetical protein